MCVISSDEDSDEDDDGDGDGELEVAVIFFVLWFMGLQMCK